MSVLITEFKVLSANVPVSVNNRTHCWVEGNDSLLTEVVTKFIVLLFVHCKNNSHYYIDKKDSCIRKIISFSVLLKMSLGFSVFGGGGVKILRSLVNDYHL